MPRCRRLIILASTVLVCFVARPGSAEWGYRASAAASAGVIENPRAMSSQSNSRVRGMATTQGGLDLFHIGRLNRESLAYSIMLTSWFPTDQSLYLTHTLRLSEMIEASPDSRLGLSAGAMLSQRSILDATVPTDPQTSGPRPAGDQKYLSFDATQTFSTQFAGSWQFNQSLDGRMYRSLGAQSSSSNRGANLDLGIARAWSRDSVFSRVRLGVMSSTINPTAGQTAPPNRTGEAAQLQLGWSRVWTAELSHSLGAGGFVMRMDRTQFFPSASANLSWRSLGYQVDLRAARAAQSNVFIGQVYVQNLIGLQCSLPLDRQELIRASADASVERDTFEASTLGAGTTATVTMGRLGLAWQPSEIFTVAFQYMIRDQRGTFQNVSAPDPSLAIASSYRQQTAMLSVAMQYPPSSMLR